MSEKVLLILVDGMRPDSLDVCNHPFIRKMKEEGIYIPTAQTVMPSVTLPCHMSLFHSVARQTWNFNNTYTPQVRPINGICEQLHLYKRQAVSLQLGRVERFVKAGHHFLRLLYLGPYLFLRDCKRKSHGRSD